MTVFIQTKDQHKRTIITVYDDEHEAERGYVLASAGPFHACFVDEECDYEVGRQIKRLSDNELALNPRADLSGLATHEWRGGALFAIERADAPVEVCRAVANSPQTQAGAA